MFKNIKQFLKLEPRFIWKGIKFYDHESIENLEKLLLEVSEQSVKDYLVKKLQIECEKEMQSIGFMHITPEFLDNYQKKIDHVKQFGPIEF